MKLKFIRRNGKLFLIRLSIPIKNGSIKVHLLLNDDTEDPHKHPWNFNSLLFLGAYKEIVNGKLYRHLPFTIVRRKNYERHQVILYRLGGMKIPCITIGKYSKKLEPWCEKKTLCNVCEKHGYCLDKAYWEQLQKDNA